MPELSEQSSYAASYGRDVRGIFHALWAGTVDADYALDEMRNTVRIGLTRAFREGTKQCGIEPIDWSPEEKMALGNAIANEDSRIWSVLMFIEQNSKARGSKRGPVTARAAVWVNRYRDAANMAKVMACADKKLEWVLGPTKKHCSSCIKLAGKVKRASYWDRMGIRPQNPANPMLECQGYKCLCDFRVTDLHMSPGPLPRLP